MTRCYGFDGVRYAHDQHDPGCIGAGPNWHPPQAWIDCAGCKTCPANHCAVCTRTHLDEDHPQTCIACLDQIRTDLGQIMQLATLAEQRLANWWPASSPGGGARSNEPALPGGDLLVLTGPGSNAVDNPLHHLDEQHGDAISVATELAAFETQWRAAQHQHPNTQRPVLSHVLGYLNLHLTWAAQHHHRFADFATFARHLRGRLEAELRDSGTPIRGVACFDCGTTLTRPMQDPRPCTCPPRIRVHALHHDDRCCLACRWDNNHQRCDQGGYEDTWRCPRCRRIYHEREYWFAVRAAISEEAL